MNESLRQEPVSEGAAETSCASAVVADGDDEIASGKAMQFLGSAYKRAITNNNAGPTPVIDVPNVQFELLFPGQPIAAADLRPAGNAGLDLVATSLPLGIQRQILN